MTGETTPRLSCRGLTKAFPGVRAVTGADLEIAVGEVHAVIGENGAGKSTLMHMIAGAYAPDHGSIAIDGADQTGAGEKAMADAGIAMVFQERSLVPALSIAENIFAGRQPVDRLGLIRMTEMQDAAAKLLGELDLRLDPSTPVAELSPGQQQMVEIAKGLSHHMKVLILDEPTASLTLGETRVLFAVIRRLAAQGVAVLYVSHRMAEIFEIADRVTVLKDGVVTGTFATVEVTPDVLIARMVGRELSFDPDPRRAVDGAPIALELNRVTAMPVRDFSLQLRYGEILCLAGLLGAGRTEVCEAIFGLRPVSSGEIRVDGRPVRASGPSGAMAVGISMVPEDRKEAGLFLAQSIIANVVAASLPAFTTRGFLSFARMQATAEAFRSRLRIASPDVDRAVGALSGGNQQKVLLAKWLNLSPRILIVDEPTRGVDVGSKAEIYRNLRDLAAEGMAVLVVSSDLPEVLALAHRIVVMADGRHAGELDAKGASEIAILELAASKSKKVAA